MGFSPPKTTARKISESPCLFPSNSNCQELLGEEQRGRMSSHSPVRKKRRPTTMLLVTNSAWQMGAVQLWKPKSWPKSYMSCNDTRCYLTRLRLKAQLPCLNTNRSFPACLVSWVSIIWQSWIQLKRGSCVWGQIGLLPSGTWLAFSIVHICGLLAANPENSSLFPASVHWAPV